MSENLDFGSELAENLVNRRIFEAETEEFGKTFLERRDKRRRLKSEHIKKKEWERAHWFELHKTKLVQTAGVKLGQKEHERRGMNPIGNEEYYKKMDMLPKEDVVAACSKDLELFSEYYFRHYIKYPSGELHYWLYKTFTREIHKKRGSKRAIAAPRGGGKSSLVTLFLPVWCILYKKKAFIVIVSDTASQAEDFLREITAELLGNELIRKHFPECCSKGPVWRTDEIVTANNVRVIALGSQNKILGRRHGADRPDLFCLDDLENQDMVMSALSRERLREWFTKEILKAGKIDGTTDFFVIGTIKHEDSLLSNLLNPDHELSTAWVGNVFRAVKSFANNEDLWGQWAELYTNRDDDSRFETARRFYKEHEEEMLEGADVLWPKGESYYSLMEIKQEGEVSWWSEKQNVPLDRSKCLIEPEEIRYYEEEELENRKLQIFGALDPAVGKSKGGKGDYAAIATIGKDVKSGKIFVLNMWAYKRTIDAQIKQILRSHGRFNYFKFGIESNAFQVVLSDHLRKLSDAAQVYVPIEEIRHGPKQNKEMRIEWMYPLIKGGTVFFHKSQKLLIEQVCNWTPDGRALHDDMVDALSMALRMATKQKFRMLFW